MPTPSVQLQARALCRFSAIDHGSSHDDQALEEASKAIKIAHENGLDYWETDALLRKGAAYFGKLDYDTAQDCFDQSLKTASRNHWPRLVALAQVNLATVRDQRGQAQDLDGLATAIDYYKIHQFPIELLNPLLLLVRDKNNQSLYESALEPALGLASLAQKLTVPIAIIQGEEAVGTSYLGLQRYPDALRHFDTALNTAIQANDAATIEWETLRRAEALAKLGRFEEAETDLRKVSNRDLAAQSSQIRTHILLSQGRFAEVVREAHRLLAAHLDQYLAVDIRIAGSTAASQSGLVSQARQWASEALSLSQKANDRELEANVQLALALVDLRALAPAAGKSAAEAALQFFEAHGQQESKWRAMLYLAEAERSLGNSQKSKEQAYKALDILSALEHNWESSAIAKYENRPDVSAARHDLQKMAGR
jgi:tetratricopeptide (TPR) repeat protein